MGYSNGCRYRLFSMTRIPVEPVPKKLCQHTSNNEANSGRAKAALKEALAMADNPQMNNPKKDIKATDSLLDVFTSEDIIESPVHKLALGLGDISVHTLLEQTKQLAQSMNVLY